MPKVPEIPQSVRGKLKPTDKLIVCSRGKKLHPQDEAALNQWIDMVKARHAKRQKKRAAR